MLYNFPLLIRITTIFASFLPCPTNTKNWSIYIKFGICMSSILKNLTIQCEENTTSNCCAGIIPSSTQQCFPIHARSILRGKFIALEFHTINRFRVKCSKPCHKNHICGIPFRYFLYAMTVSECPVKNCSPTLDTILSI